jgi:phosphate starvation-inducible PhoH-like protein
MKKSRNTNTRVKQRQQPDKSKLVPLEAKTDNQRRYIRAIAENDIVICSGPAGSGKSFIASGMAAHKLHSEESEIEQIIVTRPLVCTGKELGALPGEISDKIAPYLLPMEENLRYFLSQVWYGHYSNNRAIQYRPLEVMRGATFHNSYMILDEAQNCTVDQIKMFISRMGENSKVLINGDINQNDLRGRSGLQFCMDRLASVPGVECCHLDYSDIQRNGLIGKVLQALEEE